MKRIGDTSVRSSSIIILIYAETPTRLCSLAMEESAANSPHKSIGVMRVIGEGDLVAVHSHFIQKLEDIGSAVVHVFRFENDLIVELRDIGQAHSGAVP